MTQDWFNNYLFLGRNRTPSLKRTLSSFLPPLSQSRRPSSTSVDKEDSNATFKNIEKTCSRLSAQHISSISEGEKELNLCFFIITSAATSVLIRDVAISY